MSAPTREQLSPPQTPRPSLLAAGRGWRPRLWSLLLFAILAVLVLYPVGMLMLASFLEEPPRPGSPMPGLTLENYRALLSGQTLEGAWYTLVIGGLGGLGSLVVGGGMAWLEARTDVPFKPLIRVAGLAPLFVAALIGALAWALLASPRVGYLNLALDALGIPPLVDVYSVAGIVFVFVLYYAPYSYLLLSSALTLMNPELEDAAMVHGAGGRRIVTEVTLPMVRPAIVGAAVLTFALIVENFTVPTILGTSIGIDTLASQIYQLMNNAPLQPNVASAMGVLLMVVLAVVLWWQARVMRGRSYVTVSGKGFRPRVMPLGRWKWVAVAGVALYFLLANVLPAFALVQGAMRQHQFIPDFLALFDASALSTDTFREVVADTDVRRGLSNSLILGVLTAVLGGLIYLASAYAANRSRLPGRHLIQYVTTVPVAMPAIVLGLGFLWAWIIVPLPVYGTIVILVLAYTARFLPQGFQGISGTIGQVDQDLEHAAVVSGASRLRSAMYVTFPLIRTGLLSTSLLVFVLVVRELTTSIFLVTRETPVLAVVLFNAWEHGQWDQVAAISLIYGLLLLVVVIVAGRWLKPADLAK